MCVCIRSGKGREAEREEEREGGREKGKEGGSKGAREREGELFPFLSGLMPNAFPLR